MCKEFEFMLKSIPCKEGYSYEELKNVMTDYELGVLVGLVAAYDRMDCVLEPNDTGSEILNKIIDEFDENVIYNAKEEIKADIAETLIWIGDNHPEED